MTTQTLGCNSCEGTLPVYHVPEGTKIERVVKLVHLADGHHAIILLRNGYCTGYLGALNV